MNSSFSSVAKIFLGKQECYVSKYDYATDEIECVNQPCQNDMERLELTIQVNGDPLQLQRTYFQCRANPIIFDWYPKKSILRYLYRFENKIRDEIIFSAEE